jgi:tetratricopeptide (TPR) repeat protein
MLQLVVRSQGPAVNPRRLPAGSRLLARACRPFAAIVLASPLALATPLAPATPVAQAPHVHEIPSVPKDILERPIPRRNGIGDAHDAVSTRSADAQAFYDQGLAYLHDYVWLEAARSFNQALRLDPKLAIAYVGLSYAYTELNAPGIADRAFEQARALRGGASIHDRAHIAVRAAQIAAEHARRDPARLTAYRKAIDDALTANPQDVELWLLRGVAESPDPADRGQGSTASSIRFYERALKLAPNHFAAHHYLTHAYENTNQIDNSLEHGAAYAALAPEIPHARHMHGHALRRVGRTEEAIAEFLAADRLEQDYFRTEKLAPEYDWHYQHNLDLLATSYQYLGQMKQAEARLKASFDLPTALLAQEVNKREWPVFLLARGRIDESLAAAGTLAGHPSPVVSAIGHVEAGEALLTAGRFAQAADESNAALAALRRATEGQNLVAPALKQLQGEFFLRTGQGEKGRTMLDQVAREVRARPGPDNWSEALFTLEAIARAAREAGDWGFAGALARQLFEHDPSYAGTHYALALVAEHDGDASRARAEFALARRYWRTADPGLIELRKMDP